MNMGDEDRRKRSNFGAMIPTELVTEILKRLPVKSLVKFQSICKSWKSTITDPQFISQQYQHHHDNKIEQVSKVELLNKCYYFFDDFNSNESVTIVSYKGDAVSMTSKHISRIIPDSHDAHGYYCVGYSGGVLCFFNHQVTDPLGYQTERLVLWNPSLRRTVALPHENYDCFNYGCPEAARAVVVGIGYVTSLCDLKVVRAAAWKTGIERDETIFQISVFSLNSGTWRSFQSEPKPYRVCHVITTNAVHVDGFIYWIVETIGFNVGPYECDRMYSILRFNLADEVFADQLLEVPQELNYHFVDICRSTLSLQSLREETKLALFAHHRGDVPEIHNGCDLWMMHQEDYVWIKMFNIKATHVSVINCCTDDVMEDQQVVMAKDKEEDWFLYDHHNNRTEKQIHNTELHLFWFCPYRSNLVLLNEMGLLEPGRQLYSCLTLDFFGEARKGFDEMPDRRHLISGTF